MRVLLQHTSRYRYPTPASLGAQLIRLRPATHAKARIETYGLRVSAGELRWQQDAIGNHVARVTFPGVKVETFEVAVELAAEIKPVNPFDFTVDAFALELPFDYTEAQAKELRPYLDLDDAQLAVGPKARALIDSLPKTGGTVALVVELNRLVNQAIRYVIREEPGIWTPEETLEHGQGSCRDSAVLLVRALRERGLATRFVSGYLIQLTDEGMIPDQPKGVSSDVADLHAWAEVWLPGGGWIGLDATSGLLTGEGHIPLACTAVPSQAAPIEGTTDTLSDQVSFEMKVGRLGHEARPTAPYTEEVWQELLAAGDRTDAALARLGLELTAGGEPTFNSREHPDAPEWNGEALGPTKWSQGLRLARELRRRLLPGAATMIRQGKTYPGESLPRWVLDLCGRKDGAPLWRDLPPPVRTPSGEELLLAARKLAEALARALDVPGCLHAAFEDPWRFLQDEASLPLDVDPLRADLKDAEERRRLARVLERGLATEAGHVLPLAHDGHGWQSERWSFRRGRLYLVPGDSPMGLRLPLSSLGGAPPPLRIDEEAFAPIDPRSPEAAALEKALQEAAHAAAERKLQREQQARTWGRGGAGVIESQKTQAQSLPKAQRQTPPLEPGGGQAARIRTALCVEPRDGAVRVFLPPLRSPRDFFELVAAIDRARDGLGAEVQLEGYPPPPGSDLNRIQVTPDPGVLEVNLPPTATAQEHAKLVDTVFEAALHAGLHSEKYLLDGRMAGSQGGNHHALGGPSPLRSPFVKDPRLLASLLTFTQHHPSLSYLFSGLFVGPTSQAPRVDEARHDTLSELEIALARAFEHRPDFGSPPWLTDLLFRNLLVDVTGNTHRAEICIDKLFDWRTPHGRQGLVELRAFEMPPHPRMMVAQMALLRSLTAAFAQKPYQKPLVRWGQELHDRFLLPTWMWRDFEDVLGFLGDRGLALPEEAYRAFLELRCPVAGTLQAGEVTLEVRNALEPWNVLGEEPGASGTSRYVDSSLERIEVRASGLVPERHDVLVNGHLLPLKPTGVAHERAGGVRFRAWAPPHSLQAHLGIHHPIRLDVIDRWARRSLGACAYHVWHPEGRSYDTPPLTRFEAAARRAQRFTHEGPLPWPVRQGSAPIHAETPWTLDLRRLPLDRPAPRPVIDEDAG